MVDEEAVFAFVRDSIPSAWALELLLLMRRERERKWRAEALVAELRGSTELVTRSLMTLSEAGLIEADDAGEHAYRPRTPELAEMVEALAELHAKKPLRVLTTILSAPSSRIRSFSDAFLFRKK
jgi:hypothetical protein